MKSGRPTLEDVATEAGVSRSLVSLALRDSTKVSPQKYKAVLSAVDKLNYRPNIAARSLAQQKSNVIGVVANDIRNPFIAETIDGIQVAAEAKNYQVFISTARRTASSESDAIENFINHQAEGLVVVGPQSDHKNLAQKTREVPLVVVGATIPGVDTIANDDYHGAVLAVEHLISLGHSRIVHIGGGSGGGAAGRRSGYSNAMTQANLKPTVFKGEYTEAATAEAIQEILASPPLPTGIFCANDFMAITVLDYLASEGISVPNQISVVGYDNTMVAAMQHISLTSIDQPATRMGRIAVARLISRIEGLDGSARTEIIEPTLVVRTSTAPCPTTESS